MCRKSWVRGFAILNPWTLFLEPIDHFLLRSKVYGKKYIVSGRLCLALALTAGGPGVSEFRPGSQLALVQVQEKYTYEGNRWPHERRRA